MGPLVVDAGDVKPLGASIARSYREGHDTIRVHADLITWEGDYFRVDSARIWDTPDGGVPIAVAVSGDSSIENFGDLADHLIAVQPAADLIKAWDEAAGPLLERLRAL